MAVLILCSQTTSRTVLLNPVYSIPGNVSLELPLPWSVSTHGKHFYVAPKFQELLGIGINFRLLPGT